MIQCKSSSRIVLSWKKQTLWTLSCSHDHNLHARYSSSSSAGVAAETFVVTLDNVLSEENKKRVQRLLEKRKRSAMHTADKRPRNTAVLVGLCSVKGVPSLLLTKRSPHLNSHRSEISFPGGRVDDADGMDPVKTAVRECFEEIGLSSGDIDVWGDVVGSVSTSFQGRYLSTPVIASLGTPFEHIKFNVNPREVAQVITAPLHILNDERHQSYTVFKMSAEKKCKIKSRHPKVWINRRDGDGGENTS